MRDWKHFEFTHEFLPPASLEQDKKQKQVTIEHSVYFKGEPANPGVILIHELPGMTPECVNFAEELVTEGYCVYLPLLFGNPETSGLDQYLNLIRGTFCLWREFNCFAVGEDSPISEWFRALSRHVNQRHREQGIGVIGMCLTGGFVLATMVDESILAPVISQPSLPIYFFKFGNRNKAKEDLGVSNTTIENAQQRNIPILALRFETDKLSPCERFQNLRRQFMPNVDLKHENLSTYSFNKGLIHYYEITDQQMKQAQEDGLVNKANHSVLTTDYVASEPGKPLHPTQEARDWVVSFLKNRLQ